ncbi:hypothetical protein V7122_25655, partial [Bacillus sp. JJ1532]|uniref:hypothetical protein n=1 Tax=Bacillus sp. JJ1532 TaxID=3122958 RepID=UPI002FFD9C5C
MKNNNYIILLLINICFIIAMEYLVNLHLGFSFLIYAVFFGIIIGLFLKQIFNFIPMILDM